MLETYNYEKTLLQTTNSIVDNDVYEMVNSRYRNLRKAYSSAWRCVGRGGGLA